MLDHSDNSTLARSIKWCNERIDWKEHVAKKPHKDTFQLKCHMPLPSFNKLVGMLRPRITLNCAKNVSGSGGNSPMCPKMTVAASLWFLGGTCCFKVCQTVQMDCFIEQRPFFRCWGQCARTFRSSSSPIQWQQHDRSTEDPQFPCHSFAFALKWLLVL